MRRAFGIAREEKCLYRAGLACPKPLGFCTDDPPACEFAFLKRGFSRPSDDACLRDGAALALSQEWGLSYAELIPYATPGFVAFGVFSLPAGWLADRWSREGMMAVFFVGPGSRMASRPPSPQAPSRLLSACLLLGVFAAIYHRSASPCWCRTAQSRHGIAANGVFGNLGVGSAALATASSSTMAAGVSRSSSPASCRSPSAAPGRCSRGARYWPAIARPKEARRRGAGRPALDRATVIRLMTIIFFTSSMASLIFQSVSFSLPKVLDERLTDITTRRRRSAGSRS